jgi:NTP pyrophosphatase (non-canonical NTP hydrolase)
MSNTLRKEFEAYILRDRGADYLLRNDPSIDAEHDYADPFVQEAWEAWQAARQPRPSFQDRVHPWMLQCFGEEIAADQVERNHRFVEEALELAQACGCTRSEAEQLLAYVFDRPSGERNQEVGGVMVTLAALCTAHRIEMEEAGEKELARVWTKVDVIRAKQAGKPKHSPLPGPTPTF